MLKQLSVMTVNHEGVLENVVGLVSDAGIDFFHVSSDTSSEFGNIRMLCTDPEKAMQILKNAGYLVRMNKVLGVEISEDVGSLHNLLKDVRDCRVNINYLYVCYIRSSKNPVAIMNTEDSYELEESLESKGYKLL